MAVGTRKLSAQRSRTAWAGGAGSIRMPSSACRRSRTARSGTGLQISADRGGEGKGGIGLGLADLLAQRLRMHPQIRRNVRDRPLALQRKTDPALDQLIGVLLRSGHELESISSRQDIILASEPPPNPGRLTGPSALRLNRGIDNDLRTIGFLIAAHYSIPVDRSCRTRRGRAALMPECGHWARSSSPRAPRAAHPPRTSLLSA